PDARVLPPFPTRRSSDLWWVAFWSDASGPRGVPAARPKARRSARGAPFVTGVGAVLAGLDRGQAGGELTRETVQQPLIRPTINGQLVAQGVQRRQPHRQTLDQRLRQTRRLRRLVEHAGGTGLAQTFAQLRHLSGAGLHLADAEHAGMAQPVGRLEVVVGFVEDEERALPQ